MSEKKRKRINKKLDFEDGENSLNLSSSLDSSFRSLKHPPKIQEKINRGKDLGIISPERNEALSSVKKLF